MKAHLNLIVVGSHNTLYHHVIDTSTDATEVCDLYTGEIVYKVSADGGVYDAEGLRIGTFCTTRAPHTIGSCWTYRPNIGPLIETTTNDLIKAEAIVFKQLLEQSQQHKEI